jgi:hypothetical protein
MHPPALGALKATDFPWKLLRRDRGVEAEADTAAERELVAATVVAAATELDNAATQDAISFRLLEGVSSEREFLAAATAARMGWRQVGGRGRWGDGGRRRLRRGNLAMADVPTATLS